MTKVKPAEGEAMRPKGAIAHRIRALLTKTVENGCTEDEAIAAAQKARELMDKHRLSMTDIELKAEPVGSIVIDRPKAQQIAAVDYCMGGIERYCGIKMWLSSEFDRERGRHVRRAKLFGLASDIDMARYLYEMIAGCIESEVWSDYNGLTNGRALARSNRAACDAFQVGMAQRVNQRLVEMARALDNTAKTGSGTALVVVKNAVVEEAFAKLGLIFGKAAHGMSARDAAAFAQGTAAGDRVNLNRPVGSETRGALQ